MFGVPQPGGSTERASGSLFGRLSKVGAIRNCGTATPQATSTTSFPRSVEAFRLILNHQANALRFRRRKWPHKI